MYKESWEPGVGDLVTFERHISEIRRTKVPVLTAGGLSGRRSERS